MYVQIRDAHLDDLREHLLCSLIVRHPRARRLPRPHEGADAAGNELTVGRREFEELVHLAAVLIVDLDAGSRLRVPGVGLENYLVQVFIETLMLGLVKLAWSSSRATQ